MTTYPEAAGQTQKKSLSSIVVGAGVGREVVVDIEVVEQALTCGVVVGLHLLEEPRDPVDVVVRCVVGVANLAGPV